MDEKLRKYYLKNIRMIELNTQKQKVISLFPAQRKLRNIMNLRISIILNTLYLL